MLLGFGDAEPGDQVHEAVVSFLRVEVSGEAQRIDEVVAHGPSAEFLGTVVEEVDVEVDVVAEQEVVADPVEEVRQHIGERGRVLDHGVVDAGDFGYDRGDWPSGVDELLASVGFRAVSDFDGSDFDDVVPSRVEARGFEVERDVVLAFGQKTVSLVFPWHHTRLFIWIRPTRYGLPSILPTWGGHGAESPRSLVRERRGGFA